MGDLIKREDVLKIIEARFAETMIGDILKQDISTLPEAAVRSGDRISRCELFNRLATITGEDANDMKAKIYAVIQEMDPVPDARQGSWEVRPAPEDDRVLGRRRYYCSECGDWNTYGMSDFCPRCGADMRKTEPQMIAEDINRRVEMVKKEWDIRHTETNVETMSCQECKHWKYIAKEWQCETEKCQGYEPKTEQPEGEE